MSDLYQAVSSIIWGAPMLFFFLAAALYFSVRSGFFQLRGFPCMLRHTLGSIFRKEQYSKGISPFSAFCSVLAACIGTGNIVGVATALCEGGPGALFWMILSAALSMMTAYAENFLGVRYRRKDALGKECGGAFSYMEHGVKMKGLAKVYAVFCLLSVLGMGDMAQSNSIAESLQSGFRLPPVPVAVVITLLLFLILKGGLKRIAKISTILVPLMTAAFLALSAAVLIRQRENLPAAAVSVFREAFTLRAVGGYGTFKAMRYGISRGVFSNEAGLGSSTILNSEADCRSPQDQGMWGMFEVFCDTVFLCTVMGLVILVSGAFDPQKGLYGAALSVEAFSVLGEFGRKSIAVLTAVFAFASLTGCSFYGKKSTEYLFSARGDKIYLAVFLLLTFFGALTKATVVWTLSDIFNGFMAIPNLFSLLILRKETEYPKKIEKRRTM